MLFRSVKYQNCNLDVHVIKETLSTINYRYECSESHYELYISHVYYKYIYDPWLLRTILFADGSIIYIPTPTPSQFIYVLKDNWHHTLLCCYYVLYIYYVLYLLCIMLIISIIYIIHRLCIILIYINYTYIFIICILSMGDIF